MSIRKPVYEKIFNIGKWTLSRNAFTGDYRLRNIDTLHEHQADRDSRAAANRTKWEKDTTFTPLGSVSGRFSSSHENPCNTPKTRSAFLCDKAKDGWWCSRLPGHDGACALRRFADCGMVKPLFITVPNGVGKSWVQDAVERVTQEKQAQFKSDICRIFQVPERMVGNTPFGMPYGGDFYSDLAKGLGVSRDEAKTAAYKVAWGIEPKETVNGVFGNCTLCGKPIDDAILQGHSYTCLPLENNTCTCGGWEQPVCPACSFGTVAPAPKKKEEEPATYAAVPPTFTGKDWWKSPANEALVTAYWGSQSRFVKEFARKAQTIRAIWVAKGLMTRADFSNWVLANDRALVTPMNTDEKKQLEQMGQYIAKGFIVRNDVRDWEERRILKLRNYYRKNPKKECAHTYPCEIHEENSWGVCRCCAQREAEVRRGLKPVRIVMQQSLYTPKNMAAYSDNTKSPTAVPWPPKYVHRSVFKYQSKTTGKLESLGKVKTVTLHYDRAALTVCVTPDEFLASDLRDAYNEQRPVFFSLTTPGVGRYLFPAYIQSVINDWGTEHSFTFSARVRTNELTDKPELDFFPV